MCDCRGLDVGSHVHHPSTASVLSLDFYVTVIHLTLCHRFGFKISKYNDDNDPRIRCGVNVGVLSWKSTVSPE